MNPFSHFPFSHHSVTERTLIRILKRTLATTLTLIMILMTVSCAASGTSDDTARVTTGSLAGSSTAAGSSDSETDDIVYVTSVYPLFLAASQIARSVDGVTVVNLTDEVTGCLHDYQLTTGNMKTLEEADAFIINGVGLEGYLEQIASDLPDLQVMEATKDVPLLDDNPHVWVSVSLMIRQVETIAAQMGAFDPVNRDAYNLNAQAYLDRLSVLRQKMHDSISTLSDRRIITVHEAFPYFAAEFGLEIVGIIEREPDSEPSAAELAATIELIREQNVKAVFAEPQYPVDAARQIAEESGARLFTLDPVSSGDLQNLDAYLEIMEQNRQVLVEALQ